MAGETGRDDLNLTRSYQPVMDLIMTREEQLERWVKGEPVHNGKTVESGECCPDFSCCDASLLWPVEERKIFRDAYLSGNVAVWERMLVMGLSQAVSLMEPNTKVHIVGDDPKEV
jgi:hypothetical protein